ITAYIIGNQYTKEIPLNETTSINGYNDFNITNPVQTNMAPIVKQQTESSPYLQLRNFLQLYNSPNPIPVYEALVNVQNTITDGENMFLFSGKTLRYGYLDNSPNVIYVEFEMLKYNKQNEILII
ncbi:MAG: hypothetical protein ORN58_05220, partial [Sediminibacterium sp.]|nr:hypothetical protein [Sediminibacterium sp.]